MRTAAGECALLSLSDLPISSIGYQYGYLNNTSFTRAFARRFGMAPTVMRLREKAHLAESEREAHFP